MPDLPQEKINTLRDFADKYALARPDYTIDSYIASGGSAAVFKMATPKGFVALKVYDPALLMPENRIAEIHRITLQERLVGKHCDSVMDTYCVGIGETCFVEMEYIDWPQLKSILNSVPDEKIPSLIIQLVDGVKHLELYGLVHRDIKPENILVSPDFTALKLIDFGVVRDLSAYDDNLELTDHGQRKPFIATAQYSSPEYLFRLVEPSEASWRGLSIYQVGAVLHDMLTKTAIFYDEALTQNRFILAMAVLRKRPLFDLVVAPNLQYLKHVATNCLIKDFTTRIALVAWSDFEIPKENAMERAKRQLIQKKALSAVFGISGKVENSALAISRFNRIQDIFDSIRARLMQELGAYVKFEYVSPKENSSEFEIKAILSDGRTLVDFRLFFLWGEDDEAEIAKSYCRRNGDDVEKNGCHLSPSDELDVLFGVANLNGVGQNELVQSACEQAAKLISDALARESDM